MIARQVGLGFRAVSRGLCVRVCVTAFEPAKSYKEKQENELPKKYNSV